LRNDQKLRANVGGRPIHPALGVLEGTKSNNLVDEPGRDGLIILLPDSKQNRPTWSDCSDNLAVNQDARLSHPLQDGTQGIYVAAGVLSDLVDGRVDVSFDDALASVFVPSAAGFDAAGDSEAWSALALSEAPLVVDAASPFRLSVTYQPEPLKIMPTGWMTRRHAPPQVGQTLIGSSVTF
jgi:hypothetical protein